MLLGHVEFVGYTCYGEVSNNIYQWMENDSTTPMIILARRVNNTLLVFKGDICIDTQTFTSIPLSDTETRLILMFNQDINQLSLVDFFRNTSIRCFDYFKSTK